MAKHTACPCFPDIHSYPACGAATNWNAGTATTKAGTPSSQGESSAPFVIDDGTGKCVVDPQGAEILTRHKDSWTLGDRRYTEWRLLDIDFIYALGEFKTVGGSNTTITQEELVKQVLSEWKMDNDNLMKRFDLDNNGVLDMREWMLARSAAKREAEKRMNEALSEPDTNFMLQPHDGRLFLISNLDQDKLELRYTLWSWAHIIIFFGSPFNPDLAHSLKIIRLYSAGLPFSFTIISRGCNFASLG